MSFINLVILSYFGTTVNKETIGVCIFLIYLMLFYGWVGISTSYIKQTLRKHATRTLKDINQHL